MAETIPNPEIVDEKQQEPLGTIAPQNHSVAEAGPDAVDDARTAKHERSDVAANEKSTLWTPSNQTAGSDVELTANVRRILHYFLAIIPQFFLLSMVYMEIQFTLEEWNKGRASLTEAIIYLLYELCVILAFMILASPIGFRYANADPNHEPVYIPIKVHIANMWTCIFINSLGAVYEVFALDYPYSRFSPSAIVPEGLTVFTIIFAHVTICICTKNLFIGSDSNEEQLLDEDMPPPPDYGYNISIWIPWNGKVLLVPQLLVLGQQHSVACVHRDPVEVLVE